MLAKKQQNKKQNEELKKFGKKLRRVRRERGISIRQIKEHLGLGSVQSVFKWEAGGAYPQADRLQKVSELLGVESKIFFQYREFKPVIRKVNRIYFFRTRKHYLKKGIRFHRPTIMSNSQFYKHNENNDRELND